MVFGYIFAELMHSLHQELLEDGIVQSTSWPQTFDIRQCLLSGRSPMELPDFLDVIWADDLALAVSDPSAEAVWRKAQALATKLFDWCGRYGWRHHPFPWCQNSSLIAALQWSRNTSIWAVSYMSVAKFFQKSNPELVLRRRHFGYTPGKYSATEG